MRVRVTGDAVPFFGRTRATVGILCFLVLRFFSLSHFSPSPSTLPLPPGSGNSDPGSRSGRSSPLPPLRTIRALLFIAGRIQHFLLSSTRVEFATYALWRRFSVLYLFLAKMFLFGTFFGQNISVRYLVLAETVLSDGARANLLVSGDADMKSGKRIESNEISPLPAERVSPQQENKNTSQKFLPTSIETRCRNKPRRDYPHPMSLETLPMALKYFSLYGSSGIPTLTLLEPQFRFGDTTQILSDLSPKRDYRPKRVKALLEDSAVEKTR